MVMSINVAAVYQSTCYVPSWNYIFYQLLGNEEKGNEEPGYFSNWIMKDPKTSQFNIWYADHWHHLCIGYVKNTSSITIVKVSWLLCFKGLVTTKYYLRKQVGRHYCILFFNCINGMDYVRLFVESGSEKKCNSIIPLGTIAQIFCFILRAL